jgi:hypothetical protein
MFIPWMKPCSVAEALEVMQRGKVVSTPKVDKNNTLALVKTSEGDGYIVLFSTKSGASETRYTFMGRQAFRYFFLTVDNAQHIADETDPEPMRGTPEWYAWVDRHDEDDDEWEEQ